MIDLLYVNIVLVKLLDVVLGERWIEKWSKIRRVAHRRRSREGAETVSVSLVSLLFVVL
jgi:hypothetical protein